MIVSVLLFGALASAKISELLKHCPTTYTNWTAEPEDNWYWESDWANRVSNGESVYPVGFKQYTLAEFNEPPICIHVPNSGDKKVEILIESEQTDASICIHDASDPGYSNNDVGNVATCGKGQLYSCFTAAEVSQVDDAQQTIAGTLEDFSFYIYCQESCEASDVNLWIRIRQSEQTWDVGKTGVEDDLEMWCEMEKGTTLPGNDDAHYFTWPSELINDNPSWWPFKILPRDNRSAAVPHSAKAGLFAALLSMLGLLFCC